MKAYHSLQDIQSDLEANVITCRSLVQFYLCNIEKLQHLNAFIEVFKDEALERSSLIDNKIKSGTAGKLAGLIIGIKDVFNYTGHICSSSSKFLSNYESQYTATCLQKLLDEDAIIIGRQNCDEFAMGSSNETSTYGPSLNPIDNKKSTGGSSGGSAAAVAANLCHASIGSDTGGSVRQPASFCGVIGFKPSYG